MKYFVAFGALIACVVSALLGFTLGVNLNPESTTRYVLSWGSLGDWVAGIGAFLAVGVALWQAHKMSQDDVEKLSITQRQLQGRWAISIVSSGRRPSKVMGVALYSKKTDTILPIKGFIFNTNKVQYPVLLNYSENIDLVTGPGFMLDLGQAALHSFNQDLCDLELLVCTTLRDFRQPVLPETVEALLNASQHLFAKAREAADQ
jgi:hypothetical protein